MLPWPYSKHHPTELHGTRFWQQPHGCGGTSAWHGIYPNAFCSSAPCPAIRGSQPGLDLDEMLIKKWRELLNSTGPRVGSRAMIAQPIHTQTYSKNLNGDDTPQMVILEVHLIENWAQHKCAKYSQTMWKNQNLWWLYLWWTRFIQHCKGGYKW